MYPADLRNVALGKGRTAALADPTNKHTIENLSLTLSNSLQLKLHKDLTFDASYNINNYRRLYKDRTAANIYSDAVGVTKTTTHYQKDTYRERPYEYTYHNVDAYFTYEHSWNKEHNFKAVAGYELRKIPTCGQHRRAVRTGQRPDRFVQLGQRRHLLARTAGYLGLQDARFLRPHQLRLQGQVSLRSLDARRRHVALRQKGSLGLLPLGVGRLALHRRAVHGGRPPLVGQR